jgi:hypothetical protein
MPENPGSRNPLRARVELALVLLVALGLALAAVYAAVTGWTPRDPPAAAASLRARSEFRGFQVELVPASTPVRVNVLAAWTVRVRDAHGDPVSGAVLEFEGRMPAHGHGLPTAPRVSGETAPGDYRVEGVKFSMPGEWQLRVNVTTPQGTDTLEYELHL